MELFKVYTTSTPSTPIQFTVAKAVIMFDLFRDLPTKYEVRQATGLPISTVKAVYNQFVEVHLMIQRIVRGEAKLVREEFHYETNEETLEQVKVIDTPEELAPVPVNMTELIAISLTLMANDYDISGQSMFEANEIQQDVIDAVSYFIVEIIRCSNPAKTATFEEWKINTIGG